MGKEYIPLFLDFNETTQDLTDEECGRLIRAIVDYANGDEYASRLSGAEKIAFRFLQGLVDRNKAISALRAKAGASKNKQEQEREDDDKTEQNESNGNKSEQNESNLTTKTNTKKQNQKQNQNRNQMFDRFWSAYPRHEAKQTAMKAFEKLNPDEDLLEDIISAIEKQKKSLQWEENGGQFIPHPSTWLNQHRWEDEVKEYRQDQKKLPAQDYQQRDYFGYEEEALERMLKIHEEEFGERVGGA